MDADAAADAQAIWLPFFSFKFWTFSTCFFGLTGVALTKVSPGIGQAVIVPVSLAMGGFIGTLMAWSLRQLRRSSATSLVGRRDLVGLTGTVELPFGESEGSRGKVRVAVKGRLFDYTAITDASRLLESGEKVLAVSKDGNTLRVVPEEELEVHR